MSSPLRINLIGDVTPLIGRIFDGVADLNGGELEIEIDPDSPLLVSHDRFKDVTLPAEVLYSEWRSLQAPEPNPFPCANDKVLYMDTETHNAGKQWSMSPREFFRLGQYAWGIDGDVHLTTDYDEMMDLIASAEGVVAHNGHNFDWSTLYGQDSMTPLFMARDRKLLDTMVWANLAFPAPESYTDRAGHTYRGVSKPEQIKRWLSLDNLAFQFGIEGKHGDLKELAKKHNPEGTKVADLDYGLIPVDDPEFVGYARQDIVALQGITRRLCLVSPMTGYDWREQLCAGLNAQITRNGFMVDTDLAQGRVNQLAKRREEIMNRLVAEYDFPTEGKSPWASNAGKDAIVRIFADYGITPETHIWPRTPKGALKLGGDELKKLAEGTEAEEIANALAEIKGQRSLAQLTLDNTQPDSKVHPDIDDLQRSGRSSVTRPGLTVWNARGGNTDEKSYYVAEPGCKLVSFDLSNADARAVAAYSQDGAYRENFLPGVDNHMNVARMVYGDQPDFVNDKNHPDGAKYRQLAKGLAHSWNYGGGAKTISRASGQPLDVAEHFVAMMNRAFPKVVAWRNRMATMGERDGYIENKWGRRMPVVREQAYTQSAALMGQSGTREIMKDALIKMLNYDPRLIGWVKVPVHDELIFSIPESELAWAVPKIEELMYYEWDGVEFYASHGTPANDWEKAGH